MGHSTPASRDMLSQTRAASASTSEPSGTPVAPPPRSPPRAPRAPCGVVRCGPRGVLCDVWREHAVGVLAKVARHVRTSVLRLAGGIGEDVVVAH
eukprot:7383809-Prymnesium_polylepis.2